MKSARQNDSNLPRVSRVQGVQEQPRTRAHNHTHKQPVLSQTSAQPSKRDEQHVRVGTAASDVVSEQEGGREADSERTDNGDFWSVFSIDVNCQTLKLYQYDMPSSVSVYSVKYSSFSDDLLFWILSYGSVALRKI